MVVDMSSKPTFQVISCGLPRTGTTTTGRALSILLSGRVFDGGNDSFSGSPHRQCQLLALASRCPVRTPADRAFVIDRLRDFTEGCVASTDQPGCYFVEELLELYPHAKVICTTREKASWWASYVALWTSIHELSNDPLLWLSPVLRRFCVFSFEFWRRVPQAVGMDEDAPAWPMVHHEGLYEGHAEYVRGVVPEGELFYFDVRDGWGPLCDILGVDVPDQPFPHEFPRSWLTSGTAAFKAKLRKRFALLVGVVGSFGFGLWRWRTGRLLFPPLL